MVKYVYFVSLFAFEDSLHYPVCSTEKYSADEYNTICNVALKKSIDNIYEHRNQIHITNKSINKKDLIQECVSVLCSDFDFEECILFDYDIDDMVVSEFKVL